MVGIRGIVFDGVGILQGHDFVEEGSSRRFDVTPEEQTGYKDGGRQGGEIVSDRHNFTL